MLLIVLYFPQLSVNNSSNYSNIFIFNCCLQKKCVKMEQSFRHGETTVFLSITTTTINGIIENRKSSVAGIPCNSLHGDQIRKFVSLVIFMDNIIINNLALETFLKPIINASIINYDKHAFRLMVSSEMKKEILVEYLFIVIYLSSIEAI